MSMHADAVVSVLRLASRCASSMVEHIGCRAYQLTTLCMYVIGSALLVGSAPAHAQDWPSKPVRLVFPYQPGGGGETFTRLLFEQISQRMGQNFIVDNRPGAGGSVGTGIVAKARADGYTLLGSGVGHIVVAPIMLNVPYDPIKDFTHIAVFGGPPQVLVASTGLLATNVKQIVELSLSQPKGLVFGTVGLGSHGHLVGEMFRSLSGATMSAVPYTGGAGVSGALAGGHIPIAFVTLGSAAPLLQGGKIRMMAVTSAKRLPDFPDIPTFAELGYPDMVAATWFGVSAPAGVPKQVVERLNLEVRAAMTTPPVRARLLRDGAEAPDFDSSQTTAFVLQEIKRWAPLAREVRSSAK